VVDQRDRLLVKALADLHEQRSQEAITVAVVYGAGHIAAVVHAMSSMYKYVARDGEYLTVC
jgi:pheromone shutdown protein TraB